MSWGLSEAEPSFSKRACELVDTKGGAHNHRLDAPESLMLPSFHLHTVAPHLLSIHAEWSHNLKEHISMGYKQLQLEWVVSKDLPSLVVC